MLIHNLAGIVTGDAAAPTVSAGSVTVADDGTIAAVGGSAAAAGAAGDANAGGDAGASGTGGSIDAHGGWVLPGLWDGWMHLYFGDHTPRFQAVGALASSVGFGVTTAVAAGPAPVPGAVRAARFQRELAVLTMKSWVHERPRGIHVHAGAVTAHPGWGADDLGDLAACDADLLLLPVELPAGDAARLAKTARVAGLRVGLRLDGEGAAAAGAAALDELLGEVRPTVATAVNAPGLPGAMLERLLEAEGCSLGLMLAGDLGVASQLARACADRGQPERPFLGTGTPDERGVFPAGMPLFIDVLSGLARLPAALTVAMATGNVARAYGRRGGIVRAGEPADLAVLAAGTEAFVSPWLMRPEATLIDGRPDLTQG
jgi:hypothetical protein